MQTGGRPDLALETNVELSQRCLADPHPLDRKDDQAGELRQGFRDQDSGNDRSSGKMPAKEVLVAQNIPAGFGTNAELDLEDSVRNRNGGLWGSCSIKWSARNTVVYERRKSGEILKDVFSDLLIRDLDAELFFPHWR